MYKINYYYCWSATGKIELVEVPKIKIKSLTCLWYYLKLRKGEEENGNVLDLLEILKHLLDSQNVA